MDGQVKIIGGVFLFLKENYQSRAVSLFAKKCLKQNLSHHNKLHVGTQSWVLQLQIHAASTVICLNMEVTLKDIIV